MLGRVELLLCWLASLVKSRHQLQAENLVLRHQLNILRRRAPRRVRLSSADRLVFVWLYRLCPAVVDGVAIFRPETLIRWHRRGFMAFWRWKSRSRGGRPAVPREIRRLIQEMSRANWLWGAPRIHGELLKLGIEVAESTVAKYMLKRPRRPGQSWATFLRNHADGIAAADRVGPVVALTFRATVDVPSRFANSKAVGAVFGLTPRQHQSGEVNRMGYVSKCGDAMMRAMLFEAAQVMLTRTTKWSWLKAWGMKVARHRGMKRAIVALARRMAVVMHRMWVDGTEFRWTNLAEAA